MRSDARLADRIDVVERRAESDGLHDRRRTRLEFVWRLAVSDAILEYLMDHFATAVERRHRHKMLVLAVKRTNAGRPIKLVAGEGVKIAVNVANVDVEVHHRLRA